MGINQAARAHSTTLKDRPAVRVKHRKKSGPEHYLIPQEEEELVDFLKKCSNGIWKNKERSISIVERALMNKKQSLEHFKGEGWWNWFTHCHCVLVILYREQETMLYKGQHVCLFQSTLKDHDCFMFIFKGENFNHQWLIGKVPGTLYGMRESGWIDQDSKDFTPDALKRGYHFLYSS